MNSPSDFLTAQEAAIYLKTTPGTIAKWCRMGLLPAIKLGKVWRISRSELNRRLAASHTGSQKEDAPER
jgi:excisionase family DNA binding protein